ncbi:hypothetical protein BDC45DRAFT_535579 [Circinella umbellata]|nr:hypothetical protein BDC45DRAFT_535579 [Circinella umbellata]
MYTPSENRRLKKKFKRSLRRGERYIEEVFGSYVTSNGQLIPQSRYVSARSLEDGSSRLDRTAVNTSNQSQSSSYSQEYADDNVGTDSNAMRDNVNNHFGSILDEIVTEYVTNVGCHGKPSYSETTLFGDSWDCATTRIKEVLCVYLTGIHNTKDALTLVRHNLFPASPKLLVTAFHFTFLEFFALLQDEGYLAVQAFAAASATAHKYQDKMFVALDETEHFFT